MILRASAAFAKRFKCAFSTPGPWSGKKRRSDEWSCHLIRLGPLPVVVAMHDATLYVLVIPVTGVKTFEAFFRLFLARVKETWERSGSDFDSENQSVIVLSRTDRTRIGSMNDAILSFRLNRAHGDSLESLETKANHTPYKAIGYNLPDALLQQMLV